MNARHCLWFLVTGWIPISAASAQSVPPRTPEGFKAYQQLAQASVDGDALKIVQGNEGNRVPVIDEKKLASVLKAQRRLLTPALRDAIINNWFHSQLPQKQVDLAFLKSYAALTRDDSAHAFANFLTAVHERARKPAAAVPFYEAAGKRFQKLDETGWSAVCYTDLGLLSYELANYPRSIQALEQALPAWRKVHTRPHAGLVNCLTNLGLAHHSLGHYDKAIDYHRQALKMQHELSDTPTEATVRCLYNLGAVCHSQGDYAQALDYHQRALAVARQISEKPNSQAALALDNIGAAYAALDRFDQAIESLQAGLQMRRELSSEPNREIAQSLHNLGTIYSDAGQSRRALEFFEQARAIKQKLYDQPHPDLALTLHNLSAESLELKQYDEAIAYSRQALAIWQKNNSTPNPQTAYSLYMMALAQQGLKSYQESQRTLETALRELFVPAASPPLNGASIQPDQLRPLPVTVRILKARGELQEALLPEDPSLAQLEACQHWYAMASEIQDRTRREQLAFEASKLHLGAETASLPFRRVDLCRRMFEQIRDKKHLREALFAAEEGRANVFLDELAQTRAGVLGGVDPQLRKQEEDLLEQLRSLDLQIRQTESQSHLTERSPAELWQDRDRIRAELETLTSQLAKRYPRYAALKSPQSCTLEEAQSTLAAHETALHFVLGDSVSLVLVLEGRPLDASAEDGLAIYQLPDRDTIVECLETLIHPEIRRRPSRMRALASELFDHLFGPLANRLKGRDLVIIPDDELGRLPFELLIEQDKFLIENHRIRYAPSLTALHWIRQWRSRRDKQPDRILFGLGDPVFDQRDNRLTGNGELSQASANAFREYVFREGDFEENNTFPRLIHTTRELKAIGRLLRSPDVFTGTAATEAALKQASQSGNLARYRYLHLATHGVTNPTTGRSPALVFCLPGVQGQRDAYGQDDGFLELGEVTHLKLNADLVVLSACQSAEGKLHEGEGLVGLGRAFLHAGGSGVVCSLWRVADQETADIMTQFYEKLSQGQSPNQALAEIKRTRIQNGSPVTDWAPFILMGESVPLPKSP